MKVNELINKLTKLKEKHGNIDVIIDYDENGWYASEEVNLMLHKKGDEKDCKFINIKSSNEC